MKSRFMLFTGLLFSISLLAQAVKKPVAAPAKNIAISLTPLKNCKVYLGSYYGKGRVLVDSAQLNDKSVGVFKGPTKLPGGIYFIVSPQYTVQFELLIGNQQQFSIAGDTAQKDNPVIKGSPDNDLFKEYSAITIEKGKALMNLNQQMATAKTKEDSAKLRNEIVLRAIKPYNNQYSIFNYHNCLCLSKKYYCFYFFLP